MRALGLPLVGLLSLAAACGGSAANDHGSSSCSSSTTGSSSTSGSASTTSSSTTGSSSSTSGTGGGATTGSGSGGATSSSATASSSSGSSSSSTTSSSSSGGTGGGVPAGPKPVPKTSSEKVYVHMMPWFETPATSSDGKWGIHWTMANQNPDVVDATGKRQIASHYYPLIGPYASGDHDVIEYQLLLMKYAGVDGVLIDWPGTIQAWDYPKNVKNVEAIIALTAPLGLDFAVVYEDHNVALAQMGGFVTDEIAAGKADLAYLQSHYWPKPNYIRTNGAPLLLDFGPQTFMSPSDWDQLFAPLSQKPTFVTLWYDSNMAGSHASGEFAWIYSDFTSGLTNFYQNHPLPMKLGVAYPGFDTFYAQGGWGGPTFTLPYNGTGTFAQTLDMALAAKPAAIQLATWNDYGEGTMIEPTRELGYGCLTTLQQKLGVSYGQNELDLVNKLYGDRKQYAGNAAKQAQLDQAFADLAALQVSAAAGLL